MNSDTNPIRSAQGGKLATALRVYGAYLPPLEAVARGVLEGVVVVVPALAEGQDAHPPVVARGVAGVVRLQGGTKNTF